MRTPLKQLELQVLEKTSFVSLITKTLTTDQTDFESPVINCDSNYLVWIKITYTMNDSKNCDVEIFGTDSTGAETIEIRDEDVNVLRVFTSTVDWDTNKTVIYTVKPNTLSHLKIRAKVEVVWATAWELEISTNAW